jgi:type I restriction enzyme, S subunit
MSFDKLSYHEGDALNLPKGWEIKKFGEVCVSASSNVSQNKLANDEGDYPIYGASGLIKKVSFYHQDKPYLSIVKDGSGVGRVTKMDAYTSVIGTLQYILPKENIDLDYLNYSLMSVDFKKYVAGAAIPHIYFKDYKNEPLLWMPLPKQQHIVSILDEAFAAIAKAKANAEQNLLNAKELFDCVLDSILYDKKWNVKQLGEVCLKVEYGSSTKSTTKGKLPVLRMGNIQNGRFVWNNLVYSENEEDNKQYLLKHNDVLFNRTNSPELVGKTAIYKSEMPAIFAGYLIRLHRNEDLLDADFLNYYLNSKMAFDYGKTVVISSVNQANINGTKLKTYPIPLPTLEQQKTIVRQLDALRAKTQKLEAVYQKKIDDLEELKKSILQKAFAGELKTEKVELCQEK